MPIWNSVKYAHAMLCQAAILSHFATFRQESTVIVIGYSTWRAYLSAWLISSTNITSAATSTAIKKVIWKD